MTAARAAATSSRKPLTLAALGSKPRGEIDRVRVAVEDRLEGDTVLATWTCPFCKHPQAEPVTEPRYPIAFDPACLTCRAEWLGLDARSFRKAHVGRRLPAVTAPPSYWQSHRARQVRDGRYTAGTRIAWDTAASWAAGYVEIERRREKMAGDRRAQLGRHLAALEAETELIDGAPREDVEWIADLMRRGSVRSLPLIDACDRRLARLRQVNGDDGTRIYRVAPPIGWRPTETARNSEPWSAYRKGGVGDFCYRADLAARDILPHLGARPAVYVRGGAVIGEQILIRGQRGLTGPTMVGFLDITAILGADPGW